LQHKVLPPRPCKSLLIEFGLKTGRSCKRIPQPKKKKNTIDILGGGRAKEVGHLGVWYGYKNDRDGGGGGGGGGGGKGGGRGGV
jgi:hypothetical protein